MTSQIVTLRCGCIQGEYDCPEAQRLWAKVNLQYKMLQGYPTSFLGWADYNKALDAYRLHKRQLYEKGV